MVNITTALKLVLLQLCSKYHDYHYCSSASAIIVCEQRHAFQTTHAEDRGVVVRVRACVVVEWREVEVEKHELSTARR